MSLQRTFVVAYHLMLFARVGDPVAQHLLPTLAAGVSRRCPEAVVTSSEDGVGWAICDVSSGPAFRRGQEDASSDDHPDGLVRGWPITVNVTTRPDSVRERVVWGRGSGGPDELVECDALVEMILVGPPTDWRAVRAICESVAELGPVVLHDEVSGFAVSLDGLP
jgi:hypothetical protein